MGKAVVLTSPPIDYSVSCNTRKRIHCRASPASNTAGSSQKKKRIVHEDHNQATESSCQRQCTDQGNDEPEVDDTSSQSPGEGSVFTQGSQTRCDSSSNRFLSVRLSGSKGLKLRISGRHDEEASGNACHESVSSTLEMKQRQLKSTRTNTVVSNVRSLLSTGLLEGLPIKYLYQKYKIEVPGFIKDQGYVCGCSSCNYTKVLSALEFERHSGATSKNQNDHIFLSCGRSLYNVVKALVGCSLNSLDNEIERVIGCSPNWECYESWKESLNQIENPEVQDANWGDDGKKCTQPDNHHRHQFLGSLPEYTQESTRSGRKSDMQEAETTVTNNVNVTDGWSQENGISLSLKYEKQGTTYGEKMFSGSPACWQNESFEDGNIGSQTKETFPGKKIFSGLPTDLQDNSSEDENIGSQTSQNKRTTRMSKLTAFHHTLEATKHLSTQKVRSAQACSKGRGYNLHHLIFMENGLPDGSELAYCVRGQKVLKGYKVGSGIVCNCCHKEVSPSEFEAHAGWSKKRQPYRHTFTSNGVSLHDLSISLSKGQHLNVIYNEDECSVCGDGGELILCSKCPKAFHAVCMGLCSMPDGEWCCTYCGDENPSQAVAIDARMTVRVGRIIIAPTIESGCCSICRNGYFSCSNSFNDYTVLICDQCEKEYHVVCLRRSGMCDLKALPKGEWFCCCSCISINASLSDLAFRGANAIPETLSKQLTLKLQEKCTSDEYGSDIGWHLLRGKFHTTEAKILLSKAFHIFRNSFDPILERSGGDLVPAMVFGRNMGGHELGGMYCAILTVKSVVVSAALLRIFGHEAAEMPLVATIQKSQGKGYFRCLFSRIETLLRNLNVKKLVLPAMEDAEAMWVHKFGFRRMAEEQFQKFAGIFPVMSFKGTKMLEKPVSSSSGSCRTDGFPR